MTVHRISRNKTFLFAGQRKLTILLYRRYVDTPNAEQRPI